MALIGVNTMDWYWYENAPCFERQLNEGLIPALNGTDCKFYLMWANHDVDTLWNMHEDTYYPHVSIGWDNTHRNPSFKQESVVSNATPDAFEACLWRAKAWLDARPHQTPLVTINSWNEWTEGSYLLPDMRWGYGYLRAGPVLHRSKGMHMGVDFHHCGFISAISRVGDSISTCPSRSTT